MSFSRAQWGILGAFLALVMSAVPACNLFHPPRKDCDEGSEIPICHTDPTVEGVACDIDHIEKHIDYWGSITTKHPDVWGAARWTKYQQEVEAIFAQESNPPFATAATIESKVTTFQGARSRTDQAFLAEAFALNAALTGQQAGLLPPNPITVLTGTQTSSLGNTLTGSNQQSTNNTNGFNNSSQSMTNTSLPAPGAAVPAASTTTTGGATTPTPGTTTSTTQSTNATGNNTGSTSQGTTTNASNNANQTATTGPAPVNPIPTLASIPSTFTSLTTTNIARNNPVLAAMPGFGSTGLQLDPTIVLDEMKRFLDHLNEIRRVNEGDDTSDSPGYAVYLVRVPVSVLPGKRTDCGHGAEIMMTINPILGDDLLPSTFRSLVINDLVDQFSELVTAVLNTDRDKLKLLAKSGSAGRVP